MKKKKTKNISDESPEKLLGYFPLKNINDTLRTKQYFDIMQTATDYRFNVYDMMSSLIYSRAVHPCSKPKTYDEVLPKLFETTDFNPWLSTIFYISTPKVRDYIPITSKKQPEK